MDWLSLANMGMSMNNAQRPGGGQGRSNPLNGLMSMMPMQGMMGGMGGMGGLGGLNTGMMDITQLFSQPDEFLKDKAWGVGNYFGYDDGAKGFQGALKGGMRGAQLGTNVMPGWGTAIGGIAGALFGGFL